MRWTLWWRETSALERTAKSCGPGAPTLALSFRGTQFRESDGGKRARSPGRARISRKTIAQGRPDDPPVPVVLPRAFLLHADRGSGGHPAFPAPSLVRGPNDQSKLAQACGEIAKLCPPSLRGALATKQSILSLAWQVWIDSLRSQ